MCSCFCAVERLVVLCALLSLFSVVTDVSKPSKCSHRPARQGEEVLTIVNGEVLTRWEGGREGLRALTGKPNSDQGSKGRVSKRIACLPALQNWQEL